MRSRYSAYVLGLIDYLVATWHPSTAPGDLELQPVKWLGLEVRHAAGGGDAGVVEFVARCKVNGRAERMHELSRFVREQGRWYYIDGHPPRCPPTDTPSLTTMPELSLVIQEPADPAAQLILLCHAAGADAASLLPLGERLCETFPQATIVSLQADAPAAAPHGFEWFCGCRRADTADDNRAARGRRPLPGLQPPCVTGRPAVASRLLRPP